VQLNSGVKLSRVGLGGELQSLVEGVSFALFDLLGSFTEVLALAFQAGAGGLNRLFWLVFGVSLGGVGLALFFGDFFFGFFDSLGAALAGLGRGFFFLGLCRLLRRLQRQLGPGQLLLRVFWHLWP
jgi:hypothetical protein